MTDEGRRAGQASHAGVRASSRAPAGLRTHPRDHIARRDVLELLGALADKSLLVVDHPPRTTAAEAPEPAGEARYRMLETIHEYVGERATEDPAARADHAAAVARHIAHFRDFTRTAEPRLRSAEQLPWLRRVETELDNIRAALQRSLTARDEDTAFAIITAMGWFWWLRNYRDEAIAWTSRALALESAPAGEPDASHPLGRPGPVPAHPPDGADGEDEAATRYWQYMDLRLLRFFLTTEVSGAPDPNDPEPRADAQRILDAYGSSLGPRSALFPGLLWPFAGFILDGHSAMLPLMDEAVANCRRNGDDWALGVALMFRTHLAIDMPGGMESAETGLAELRELSPRVGDRWMLAQAEGAAGEIAATHGRLTEARAAFEEAQRLAREIGAHTEVPFLITRLAELSLSAGDVEGAIKLLDRSEEEADRYGAQHVRGFNRFLLSLIALLRGDVTEARACFEGSMRWSEGGTPPPQFWVVLKGLEARITADEGDLPGGLRKLRDTMGKGCEASCTEALLAQQAESAAYVLARCGQERLAARLLGAADGWRGRLPRTPLAADEFGRIEKRVRRALGRSLADELRAEGTALSVGQVIALLDDHLAAVLSDEERTAVVDHDAIPPRAH